MKSELDFNAWAKQLPKSMLADKLWGSLYQYAMYLYDLAWKDSEILGRDFRGKAVAKQLIRSIGAVCA